MKGSCHCESVGIWGAGYFDYSGDIRMKTFSVVGFVLVLALSQTARAQTATVTWTSTHQTIDGFGAHDSAPSFNTSPSILEQVFSPTSGVGLSILRVSIPNNSSLNDGVDLAGDCSTVNSGCAAISPEESYAASQGVRIFASSWSPPASMTTNGSVVCGDNGGNGSLMPGSYGTFATWLSNYIASLSQAGITLYAISPQNEPDVCPATGGIGGTLWTAANFDTFVGTNLGPTMSAAGQTSTLVALPESEDYSIDAGGRHTGMDSYASATLNDPNAAKYVSICATHDYIVTHPWQPGPDALCTDAGKRLWETEVYQGGLGQYDGSITDGLIWAQDIHYWLTSANASAWLYWQIFSPWNDNEPLYAPGTTTPATRLYVIGQWSKFVRPGWVRIDATANPQNGIYISAFKSPSGSSYAIVAVNTNDSATSQTFVLSGFPGTTSVTPWATSSTLNLVQQSSLAVGSNSFTFSLAAQSVTTFVGTTGGSGAGSPPSPPTSLSATVR